MDIRKWLDGKTIMLDAGKNRDFLELTSAYISYGFSLVDACFTDNKEYAFLEKNDTRIMLVLSLS